MPVFSSLYFHDCEVFAELRKQLKITLGAY